MKNATKLFLLGAALAAVVLANAGPRPASSTYKVLSPISSGNLTIFPVVAADSHDTREFITLDEGLRSGEVVVTESGQVSPLIRRRPGIAPDPRGPQVNRLVLVNNSDRPLILLAGEIVTGGKQDRVVGKDRIVPSRGDPVDLSVFCVEPGRWTGTSGKFGPASAQMAQPSVRGKVMADKDQQKVWNEVGRANQSVAAELSAPAKAAVQGTSSYARVAENEEVKRKLDDVAAPIRRDYESLIRNLRAHNAVGVVVAVNGEIIWADIFASSSLLEKYWPKLVRSYAAESLLGRAGHRHLDVQAAQAFLENLDGTRQVVESEPGVYRHAEITGPGFKAFELTSLLPKTGFDVHIAKMAE
jgi:hypothetical protein